MLKLFGKAHNANVILTFYRPATELCHRLWAKVAVLSEEISAGKQSLVWRSNANECSICDVWLPVKGSIATQKANKSANCAIT